MQLTRINLQDFRCFERAVIQPGPRINIITGDNASGKTSVLEAIHILGRGQSFRKSSVNQMTRHGGKQLVVHGRASNDAGSSHRIGVAGDRRRLAYKLDGSRRATRFDLVTTLPLQLVDPNVHHLFEQGPGVRRHFLDWGVFHVEQDFFAAWRQYRRALKQRNRALRHQQSIAAITSWDTELIRAAETIDRCRRRYVTRLTAMLPESLARLAGHEPPDIDYTPGWPHKEVLADVLQSSLVRDQQAGFTQHGPHRADLRINVAGVQARAHVSRGQQKVLAAALLLTQANLLQQEAGVSPVLLIDDLAAELGPHYRNAMMREIQRLECQCFITFLEPAIARDCCGSATMFHVEHSQVKRM